MDHGNGQCDCHLGWICDAGNRCDAGLSRSAAAHHRWRLWLLVGYDGGSGGRDEDDWPRRAAGMIGTKQTVRYDNQIMLPML